MSVVPKYPLQEVDVITLKQWLENQEALLIDVREPAEYVAEHIPGARLLSQLA
ncbi:MAG: rhodanese-like domain-containing protein [Leptolyngbyaceae cyanobacterium]|mgnify:CR=1 FL=1